MLVPHDATTAAEITAQQDARRAREDRRDKIKRGLIVLSVLAGIVAAFIAVAGISLFRPDRITAIAGGQTTLLIDFVLVAVLIYPAIWIIGGLLYGARRIIGKVRRVRGSRNRRRD